MCIRTVYNVLHLDHRLFTKYLYCHWHELYVEMSAKTQPREYRLRTTIHSNIVIHHVTLLVVFIHERYWLIITMFG